MGKIKFGFNFQNSDGNKLIQMLIGCCIKFFEWPISVGRTKYGQFELAKKNQQ